jgi:hypothetical protein
MHRFIPALLQWRGFRVGETKITHRRRTRGKTKYGPVRIFKGLLDLLVVVFWQRYSGRPIHLFGGLGILLMVVGGMLSLYLALIKIVFEVPLAGKNSPLLAVFLVVLGVQFFVSGIIADIAIKNYHASSSRKTYLIERVDRH